MPVCLPVQSTCCSFKRVLACFVSLYLCILQWSFFSCSFWLCLNIAPVETIGTRPTCMRIVAQPHYCCGILGNAVIFCCDCCLGFFFFLVSIPGSCVVTKWQLRFEYNRINFIIITVFAIIIIIIFIYTWAQCGWGSFSFVLETKFF